MAHALADVAWEDCLLEPRRDPALEAFVRETQGMANPTIRYFASVPCTFTKPNIPSFREWPRVLQITR